MLPKMGNFIRLSILFLMLGGSLQAAELVRAVCPLSADALVSGQTGETGLNWGGANMSVIRKNSNYALARFDMEPARGLSVTRAWFNWYMVLSSPFNDGEISTIAADWQEGVGAAEQAKAGECCFDWASYGKERWADENSNFLDVSFGAGGSLINSSRLKNNGRSDRWGRCEIDPELVTGLLVGNQHGLAIRSLESEQETFYFLAREWKGYPAELGNSVYAGYLEVEGIRLDTLAPAAVSDLSVEALDKSDGSVLLKWTTVGDDGDMGTPANQEVRCDRFPLNEISWSRAEKLPAGLAPPGPAGQLVDQLIKYLPGYRPLFLAVRTSDEVGNLSPVSNSCRLDRAEVQKRIEISALRAVSGPGHGEITIKWRVKGDTPGDSLRILISRNEIKTSADLSNCESAAAVDAGIGTYTLTGLDPGLPFYLIALPESGENLSPVSFDAVSAAAGKDTSPPSGIKNLNASAGMNSGEILLSWSPAADNSASGKAAAYEIIHSNSSGSRVIAPTDSNNNVIRLLDDGSSGQVKCLVGGLEAGETRYFEVAALDDAGNCSEPARISTAAGAGQLNVWAYEDMARMHPLSGEIFEEGPDSYGSGTGSAELSRKNRVWDGASGSIALNAARGELAAFQLCLQNVGDRPLEDVTIGVGDLTGPGRIESARSVKLYREWYIKIENEWFPVGLLDFDKLKSRTFPIPDPWLGVGGQTIQSVWVECWIPKDVPPGNYRAEIVISAKDIPQRKLTLKCRVSDFSLPDSLSYCMHFMDYNSLPGQWKLDSRDPRLVNVEREFMRMAHRNRVNLGFLPYFNNGHKRDNVVSGHAPVLEGGGRDIRVADWSEYDKRWGPYFDGSAYAGLPREGQPVSHAYLPFHLSWPTPIMDYESDKTAYEQATRRICHDFETHLLEKGWDKTCFMIYHNEKRLYGFPADMDEPMDESSYWWLKYKGDQLAGGFSDKVKGKKVAFRIDLSIGPGLDTRLDSLVDLWVLNRLFYKDELARRCQTLGATIFEYGGMTNINQSLANGLFMPWQSYLRGVKGYVFWASMMWSDNPWKDVGPDGHQFAFLPGDFIGYDGPVATIRLKAALRAEQDMEYIYLAEKAQNRDKIVELVRKTVTSSTMDDYNNAREKLRWIIEEGK